MRHFDWSFPRDVSYQTIEDNVETVSVLIGQFQQTRGELLVE